MPLSIFDVVVPLNEDGVLGVKIKGGREYNLPIIVSKLIEGSEIAKSKELCANDVILSVNGTMIDAISHADVVCLISDECKKAMQQKNPFILLKVLRFSINAVDSIASIQVNILDSCISHRLKSVYGNLLINSHFFLLYRKAPSMPTRRPLALAACFLSSLTPRSSSSNLVSTTTHIHRY
ncbi:hypothetical protein Ciccas_009748 [Cichlidogyrus casuarinus]|uniref:PDZ domain-containing protein n=1 Tax=Cichlidogyrus casuarinus TaxID=1844966 RepID=A0ABD2PW49_9PLAT